VNDLPEVRSPYEPDVDPERHDLVERVVAAYETLMHRVASTHAPEFVGVGVTMSQAKVLYLVQADPDIRMSDLAARLGVSLPSISGVVDRLVDQGLLARRDDPSDRRQALVTITASGASELDLFRELNARQVRNLLARLDMADLAVVERALDVLAAAAAAAPRPGATQSTATVAPSSTATAASPTTITGGSLS
jgi:DNA-binding MarR family transcriptional regulator